MNDFITLTHSAYYESDLDGQPLYVRASLIAAYHPVKIQDSRIGRVETVTRIIFTRMEEGPAYVHETPKEIQTLIDDAAGKG